MELTGQKNFIRGMSIAALAGILLIAVMGLLSYLPGWQVLGSVRQDYIPMAPATAVNFIILSLLLLILLCKPPFRSGWILCFLSAVLISIFGMMTGLERFTGKSPGLEDLLIPVSNYLGEIPIGRMAPATGLGFCISGAAVLSLFLRNRNSSCTGLPVWIAGMLGSLIFLLGFVFTLAYFYGHPLMYGLGATVPMALTTALSFILLGIATVGAAGVAVFPLNTLTGNSTRAYLLRFMLPLSTLSAVISGGVVLGADRISHMNPSLISAALIAFITIAAGLLATWASHYIGKQIDKSNAAVQQAMEALHRSSERFEHAIMDAPFPAMIYAKGEEVIMLNRAWSELSGYPLDDISRITEWRQKAYGAASAPVCNIIDHLYEKGSPRHKGEVPIRTFTGETRFWDLYFSPLGLDENNRPLILEMAIDITERKEMEHRIRQLARFPADNPNPVLRFSVSGTVLYANPASAGLLSLLKQQDGKVLPDNFTASFAEILASGKVHQQEIDCGSITYALALSPLSDEGLVNLYAMDISLRKQAEKQILRNDLRLKALVNILESRAETTQELLDHALSEAIGLTESKIGYIYFYHEDSRQFVLNTWSKNVMKECEVVNPQSCYELDKTGVWGEAVRQRKPIILNDFAADHPHKKGYPKGHIHLSRFMTVPVFKGEEIVAVVGVANKAEAYDESDVLQLTLLMDAVWKSVDVRTAEQALKESLERLRISNRDLEQFAYIASHDLQEPLRMVANYMQLLERRYKDKLDQDAKDFIGYAVDGAVRMQQLIDSLLEYSRLQTRKKPFEIVDLEKVSLRVLRDLEGRILETGANVTLDPLPQTFGDAIQLGLVFQNLISNALKFRGKASPEIHISAEELSNHWKITVRDNGIGIEPEHQEKIFKIFQRLHSRAEYPGTGIGLTICRRIIERHGGETGVESAVGKGSTFWFTLPKKGET